MQNKQYRGLVVVAPPHLNPKQQSDCYVFSGVAIPSNDPFACSFRVIPLPGFTMPEKFAADVAAQNPLPGKLELFATDWDFGSFSYKSPGSGDPVEARADDAMQLSPEQLREPAKQPERPPEPPPSENYPGGYDIDF